MVTHIRVDVTQCFIAPEVEITATRQDITVTSCIQRATVLPFCQKTAKIKQKSSQKSEIRTNWPETVGAGYRKYKRIRIRHSLSSIHLHQCLKLVRKPLQETHRDWS